MNEIYRVIIYKKENEFEPITLEFPKIMDALNFPKIILKFSNYSYEITKMLTKCGGF